MSNVFFNLVRIWGCCLVIRFYIFLLSVVKGDKEKVILVIYDVDDF